MNTKLSRVGTASTHDLLEIKVDPTETLSQFKPPNTLDVFSSQALSRVESKVIDLRSKRNPAAPV